MLGSSDLLRATILIPMTTVYITTLSNIIELACSAVAQNVLQLLLVIIRFPVKQMYVKT